MPVLPRRQDPDDRRGHGRGAAVGHRARPGRLKPRAHALAPANRRALFLGVVLFAIYAATLGLHAFGRSDYAGGEPHYLLTARSLVEDGNADLADEYRSRAYSSFYPYALDEHGVLTKGRRDEPHGVGFPLLIAPAYAIAGAKGVEVFLAGLAALAVALGYLLATRIVPDPWAFGAALALGLSPPLLAYSTAVYPELAAGAALCGAALLAARLDSRRRAWVCFGLIALLPWLGTKYIPAGAVVAAYAFRELRRSRRRVLAIACVEIVGFSAALWVGFNEGLFGGPTPFSADLPGHGPTGASFPTGYLDRSYRLVALFVDRDYGLLRWAPVLALAVFGAWLLSRERRAGLARAIPELRREQSLAAVCGIAAFAQLLTAAFLAPSMFGFWFPGRQLVAVLPLTIPLVALGLRHVPRLGLLLAALGVAASLWLYLYVRLGHGGLAAGRPPAPWGPLRAVFPRFEPGATYPYVLAALIGAAAIALVATSELGRARRIARLR